MFRTRFCGVIFLSNACWRGGRLSFSRLSSHYHLNTGVRFLWSDSVSPPWPRFSCQTSLKWLFGVLLIREAPAVQFHQTVFLYLLSLQQLFFQSWAKKKKLLQRFNHHVTSFSRLQKSVISADWSRQIIKLERDSISHRLICTGLQRGLFLPSIDLK